MRRRWLAAGSSVVALCLVGLLTAGCTSSSGAAPKPRQPAVPTFHTSTVPLPPLRTTPPTSCSGVASATDVDAIVGHPLVGSANQVVGVAEPAIHRTGRLDCYYGIPLGKAVTAGVVSIGIASYTDPTSAAHRTVVTVNSARQEGATTSDVHVDSADGVLVAGAKNQELVLSRGDLTVLVSADNGVLPAGRIGRQLVLLAQKALAGH